ARHRDTICSCRIQRADGVRLHQLRREQLHSKRQLRPGASSTVIHEGQTGGCIRVRRLLMTSFPLIKALVLDVAVGFGVRIQAVRMTSASQDDARSQLTQQVLGARTLPEIAAARQTLRDWLAAHPEEQGMRWGFEQLSQMQE